MKTNRNLLRLRHVRDSVQPGEWKVVKDGFNELAGAVLNAGLVQALFLACKGKDKDKDMKRAADILAGWLGAQGFGTAQQKADGLAVHLLGEDRVPVAMAAQAEALRLIAKAKLLANAMAD